jgi:TonB family protein
MTTLRTFLVCSIFLIGGAPICNAVNDALWMSDQYSVAVKYLGISEKGVDMPRPRSVQMPEYPYIEWTYGCQGEVFLEIEILQDGTVGAVVIEKSDKPTFAAAAEKTVKQWSFSPGMILKSKTPVTTHLHCKIGFYADEK